MEMSKNQDQIMEGRPLKQTSYSYKRRKECIKKKTMELSTLCGINACTIIYEPDGKVDSWPENPSAAKAIIKSFKDLTSDTFKKTTIRDESKRVSGVPDGEVDCWLENSRPAKRARIEDKAKDVNQMINKIVPYSSNLSLTGMQKEDVNEMLNKIVPYSSNLPLTRMQKEELLKRLDGELQALTNRIEFLKKDKQYHADSCGENKQCCSGSEKTYRIPDLNYPPPLDENSSLVPEEHGPVPHNYCLAVHCSNSSGTSGTTTTNTSVSDSSKCTEE